MRGVMKVGRGPGMVELREVPDPQPGPGEVLIEVAGAAICGSDLHIYHDRHPYWPPVILGHEFAGTVRAVGEGVRGYAPGDRVVSETSTGSCGVCFLCRSGNRQICQDKRALGIGTHGAFAPYVIAPASLLHRVPDGLALAEAALAEPTAIAVHAVVERVGVSPGEIVVISGPGPIGLMCLQVARAAGAGLIVVSGTASSAMLRLRVAREVGADVTVNIAEEDLADRVAALTGGRGADVAFETSGAPAAVEVLPRLVRRLGRVGVLGVTGQPAVPFPSDVALFKGLEVHYSFSSKHTSWVTALRLLASGRVRARPLLTTEVPLERWQEAFEAQEQGRAIKALLIPSR
ncbi:MAG: alcohol dehydrogenase catalytic domain-containing protein [Armatimonadota bacterium]|nr:alcohol dehydrogenase catalytic domain-containing protein [Armatimonadota bacterium]